MTVQAEHGVVYEGSCRDREVWLVVVSREPPSMGSPD